MKHSPQFIIWWSISRYLSFDEKEALENEIAKHQAAGNIKFIHFIKKYFDIERLRIEPIISQDIWIYNYLTWDPKCKFSKNPLLTEYEKKIMLPGFAITKSAT